MKSNRKKSQSQRFAHYRAFVANIPVGMAILHIPKPNNEKTWSVVATNWLASHLVGSSVDDYLTGAITRNLSTRPEHQIPHLIREVLLSKRTKSLGHIGDTPFNMSRNCYWAKIFPVDKNCIAFLMEDQSLLRQARVARSEANNYCRSMAELAHAILWRADPQTMEFHFISPEDEPILGYWTERWRTEVNFFENHLHSEDRERVLERCREAARLPGQAQECECRMIAVDGRILWFRLLVRSVTLYSGSELLGVMTEVSKLKETEEATRRLSRRLIHLRDEEHRRLSRELHDGLGQGLSGLKMNLDLLRAQLPPDFRQRPHLDEAIQIADSCLQEVRTVSYLLHPPILDDLGLLKTLSWYVDGFQKRSGIRVNLSTPESALELPEPVQLALFRIIQECLTNIHRHSKSESAEIRINASESALLLEVTDHGKGIPPEVQAQLQGKVERGVGLSGMRERVAELHGSFAVDSSTEGTKVRVTVPLVRDQDSAKREIEAELARRDREADDSHDSSTSRRVLHFKQVTAGKN